MKKTLTWSLTAVTALSLTLGATLPASGATTSAAATSATSTLTTSNGPSGKYLAPQAKVTAKNRTTLDRLLAQLPADWEARRDRVLKGANIDTQPAREAADAKIAAAIDPGDYICGPTQLSGYIDSILADVDPGNLFILALFGVLDFPTYDAIFYGTPKGADYQIPAAYQSSLTSTFGYAQRFWDVKLNNVQLMEMHGAMVVDTSRMTRLVTLLYGLQGQEAIDFATELIGIVRSDPGLKKGNNPIFTLNAFAFSGKEETDPIFRKLPDKMVFGDGILAALKALGLNQVGPKAVLGHEMAHHVQFEDGLFESALTGPEATRRTELMADAFGSYFATHKKGLGLGAAQLLQVEQAFYDVGDCSFTSNGHHGTPNQRRAASSWGVAVAATAGTQLTVLPSLRLDAKFEKVLPQLVASDAPKVPAVPAD
ncbi:MAG: hypothetical protein ABI083_02225 [Lapillicoccus sp.]